MMKLCLRQERSQKKCSWYKLNNCSGALVEEGTNHNFWWMGFFPLVKSEDVSHIDSLLKGEKSHKNWVNTELDIFTCTVTHPGISKTPEERWKVPVETDVSTCTQPHEIGRNLIHCTNWAPYISLVESRIYNNDWIKNTEIKPIYWGARPFVASGVADLDFASSAGFLFRQLNPCIHSLLCIETCWLVVANVAMLLRLLECGLCHMVKLALKLRR